MAKIASIRGIGPGNFTPSLSQIRTWLDFDDVDIPDVDRSKDGMPDLWGLRGRDDHDRDDHDRDDHGHHDGEGNEHIAPLPYDASAFPDGVSSGDVTQSSAVLWARASHTGKVTFQIATDAGFHHVVDTRTVSVSNTLVPAKVKVDDLRPDERYYYRAIDASGHVAEGTLETAARLGQHEGFSFGVGGDTRGTGALSLDQECADRGPRRVHQARRHGLRRSAVTCRWAGQHAAGVRDQK